MRWILDFGEKIFTDTAQHSRSISNLFCTTLLPSQRRAVVTFDPNKPVSLKSNHELPPSMLWITTPFVVCLLGMVPLLLCCGSRTLPSNVTDPESLVPWSHSRFWKKHIQGQNLRKKSESRKNLKNKLKGQGKARFFCGTTPGFSRSKLFSMKLSKTDTAAKSEEKNRMLRVTMLCLVCFRERIHPCNVIFVMDPSPRLPHAHG